MDKTKISNYLLWIGGGLALYVLLSLFLDVLFPIGAGMSYVALLPFMGMLMYLPIPMIIVGVAMKIRLAKTAGDTTGPITPSRKRVLEICAGCAMILCILPFIGLLGFMTFGVGSNIFSLFMIPPILYFSAILYVSINMMFKQNNLAWLLLTLLIILPLGLTFLWIPGMF